jgi:RHS repeat-associated protein
LGSIRDIIDAKGKVIGHREYNAFGKVTRNTGKAECIFGYTGKIFDNQTHLQWNINRWYDANVSRWISEDPIGFRGRDRNLSRYVGNKTTTNHDSRGLTFCSYWCPNLCPVQGERNNYTITDMRVTSRNHTHPGALDAANAAYDSVELLSIIMDVLNIAEGTLSGVEEMVGALLEYVAGNYISPGDTEAIQDALTQLATQLPGSALAGGVAIWTKVSFIECKLLNCCCRLCTRRKWVDTYTWYKNDLGANSSPSSITFQNILNALNSGISRAQGGDSSDTLI